MQPFLALITPVAGTEPPQPPLGIWGPTDPRPTPPIAGPGRPPWWGMAQDPGYGIPVGPPQIWGPPGPWPTPPIYFPPPGQEPPLGIWGPPGPWPSPPIAGIPGLPGAPGQQPHPEHPIVLPPNLPPTVPGEPGQPERKVEWKTAWTPTTGWVVVGIPAEGTLVPTPSSKK